MLIGYFDDSGKHKEAETSVIAGYVAHVADWRRFEIKTRQLFASEDIPYFHAQLFNSNKKHFKGWSVARKINFIERWFSLAKDSLMLGISAAANKDGFLSGKELSKGKLNISLESHCLQIVLAELFRDSDVYKEVKKYGLQIIIERAGAGDNGIYVALNELLEANEIRQYVNDVKFVDKKSNKGVQLADYLAYYSQKFAQTATHDNVEGFTDFLKIALDNVSTIMKLSEASKPNPEYNSLRHSLRPGKRR